MPNPKAFVSYSWSTPEHEEWVLNLSKELRESGVDVVLDKWDLKEGHDADAFMERMVGDESIKKVLIVCDNEYAGKANKRKGGVGAEAQIITAEIYRKVDQNKFVAVIAEKDDAGKPILPIYYTSRIYIDLSSEELYARNYEQLLRWIYDKPLYIKPELGEQPSFLQEQASTSLGTSAVFRRAIDAVKNSKPYASGALAEYLEVFSRNLERFRLELSRGSEDFDDKVISSINQFIPSRNEIIEMFNAVASYLPHEQVNEKLHEFLESLMPYMSRPKHVTEYHKWDWDNYKFIIHEIFLYSVAAFLKKGRFDLVQELIQSRYYVADDGNYGQKYLDDFSVFYAYLISLKHRNERLSLNRLSVRADLLKERAQPSGINFESLMQADFILYVAAVVHDKNWWPDTLVFKTLSGGRYPFEIFQRAESKRYFDKMKVILDISTKEDLASLVEGFRSRKIDTPRWEYDTFDPVALMNYDKLCTLP